MSKRGEATLLGMAVNRRWAVSDNDKKNVLTKLRKLMQDEDPRVSVRAVDLMVKLESQNQKDEHMNTGIDDLKERIVALAIERGFALPAGESAGGRPDLPAG